MNEIRRTLAAWSFICCPGGVSVTSIPAIRSGGHAVNIPTKGQAVIWTEALAVENVVNLYETGLSKSEEKKDMRTSQTVLAVAAGLSFVLAGCGGGSTGPSSSSTAGAAAPPTSGIINVKQDGTGDYKTISDAVKGAQPGSTINVYGGVYRESVVIPHGGTDSNHRLTIQSAPGATVVVTGSDAVSGWVRYSGNTWKLVQPNSAFGNYNPFVTMWQSGTLPNSTRARSSGGVYVNGGVLSERATLDEVTQQASTWTATVDSANTTIYANFGSVNPAQTSVEINRREQAITAAWNQSYITISGLTITHGSGPKGINYWSPTAAPIAGAVDTYGGSDWIIQNNTFTQNSGVALGFGVGAQPDVNANGGLPARYGHHLIQGNNFTNNGTNGAFAYRAPFTEVTGNRFVDNNADNTQLLSEADLKFLDGGVNIKIHDNYFYSDHSYASDFIWMDSACQDTQTYGNVFAATAGNLIQYEADFGNNSFDNNILINAGMTLLQASNTKIVHNTLVNSSFMFISAPNFPAGFAENMVGTSRRMELYSPGTTQMIGLVQPDMVYNRIMNNVFYGQSYLPDMSFPPPYTLNPQVAFANNIIDYNVYYNGAKPATTRTGVVGTGTSGAADGFSVTLAGSAASATCDPNTCTVLLPVDPTNAPAQLNAPAMTSLYMGANSYLANQSPPVYDYSDPIVTDFSGSQRGNSVIAGAFTNLSAGNNSVQVWPKK
jgi:hypothetical protein